MIVFGDRWQDSSEFRLRFFFCFAICIQGQGACTDRCGASSVGQWEAKARETLVDAKQMSRPLSARLGPDSKPDTGCVFFDFFFPKTRATTMFCELPLS